jgi:hypothetical protein
MLNGPTGRVRRVALLFTLPALAVAQESADDLAREATDPTASLMAFNFLADIAGDYQGLAPGEDDSSLDFVFRPVIPFKAWGQSHILRLTLPFRVNGPGADGLSSVTVFDLMVKQREWGRFGVGAVATLAREGAAPDEFAIGPAIGGVWNYSPKINLGLFSQTVISSDTFVSSLQPIAVYQIGDGWTLSAGDLQWAYDFKNSRWQSLPIGFQIGKVGRLGKQAVRYAINPQWNLADTPGTEGWSVVLTFAILAPSG